MDLLGRARDCDRLAPRRRRSRRDRPTGPALDRETCCLRRSVRGQRDRCRGSGSHRPESPRPLAHRTPGRLQGVRPSPESQVRPEVRAAHALRSAARYIVHTASGPHGNAVAPWSQPASGRPSWPGVGAKRSATPTRPKLPARPSSTCRRPQTEHVLRRSPNSQPDSSGIKPAACWPAIYEQQSLTTRNESSPTRTGRRSPPFSPTPKHAAISLQRWLRCLSNGSAGSRRAGCVPYRAG